jgi:hypothetical protein
MLQPDAWKRDLRAQDWFICALVIIRMSRPLSRAEPAIRRRIGPRTG